MSVWVRTECGDEPRRVEVSGVAEGEERPTKRRVMAGPNQADLVGPPDSEQVELGNTCKGCPKAVPLIRPELRGLMDNDSGGRALRLLPVPSEDELDELPGVIARKVGRAAGHLLVPSKVGA